MVEVFDAHGISFVAVTQQFNTTNSMDRLTLNVLLLFAQFEREVLRDEFRKNLWHGQSYSMRTISVEFGLVVL